MPPPPPSDWSSDTWSTKDASTIAPGDTLAGRYELVAPIGEGGMGVVWQAKQLTTEKTVAIKLLRSEGNADVARFLREAKLAAGLAHPNIIQVFDFWETPTGGSGNSLVFMVMELLQGESFGERLCRVGALSYEETLELMVPVSRALRFSHSKGVVHRDLKPDNVFLTMTPDDAASFDGKVPVVVKVVDFGLAKPVNAAAGATALTQSGSVLGTPLYMAPEMVYGERVDVKADVWALGVMMYESLVGHPPFEGENYGQVFRKIVHGSYRPLHEAAPHLPAPFTELVTRMLSHDPADRPSTVEVTDWLEREMSSAAPTQLVLNSPTTRRRSPLALPTTLAQPPSSVRQGAALLPAQASSVRPVSPATSDVHGAARARFSPVAIVSGALVAFVLTASVLTFGVRRAATRDERTVPSVEMPPASHANGASTSSAKTSSASTSSATTSSAAPAQPLVASAAVTVANGAPSVAPSAQPMRSVTAPTSVRTVKPPKPPPTPTTPPKRSSPPDDPLTGGRF